MQRQRAAVHFNALALECFGANASGMIERETGALAAARRTMGVSSRHTWPKRPRNSARVLAETRG